MKIEIINDRAFVFTPYNAEFVRKVKKCGGAKWDGDKKAWSVPANTVAQVREIMQEVYGETDLPTSGAKVSVRVRVVKEIYGNRDSIRFFGKTIASASGRDSGARVGDDVVFVTGKPTSGGSVKNWCTVIPENAEFVVHNVVQSMVADDEHIEIISVEQEVDASTDALRAEKEILLKRLAEINSILGEEN